MKTTIILLVFLLGFAISQNHSCPPGIPIVQCLVDPCKTTPPNCEGYTCVADYCGGCNARYFTSDRMQIDCANNNRTCDINECGIRPLSAFPCPDGTIGGITGRCIYNSEIQNCSWEFRTCPCPPVCLIFCPYGNVKDERGCPICRCNEPPVNCSTLCPELNCTDFFTPEGSCCPQCRAFDCRTVLCRPVEPCGDCYEAVTLPGQCCKQCVPIENCDAVNCLQVNCGRGQTRVKRGCCFVCESTVNCGSILCQRALCRPGYRSIVSEGECCPRCVLVDRCDVINKSGNRCPTTCSQGYQLVDTGKCCPQCRKIGMCDTVRCAAPNCDERFWMYHRGSCCASCPVCEDTTHYSCTLEGEVVCAKGFYRGSNCTEKVSDDERKSESVVIRVCSNNTRCPGYSEQEIKHFIARKSNVTAENIRIQRLSIQRPRCCVRYRIEVSAEKSDDFDVKKAKDSIENSIDDSEFQVLPTHFETSAGNRMSWFGLF